MSVVPEVLLQRAIIDGMKAIRQNPKVINMIFKNLPVAQQEAIKSFITGTVIDFAMNYPRDGGGIKSPGIVLMLKNESEAETFLGDLMGAPPNYDMPDADMTFDTLGGNGASVSNVQGLPKKVVGPLNVATMLPQKQAITLTAASFEQLEEVFAGTSNWPSLFLYVVAGAGAGKTYRIDSITPEQLDIVGTFELDLDSTSVVDIRYESAPEAAYGNPVRQYEENLSQLRVGANYDSQYQLDVIAGNQEEVIYLYTVLKAILFAQRKFLEAQGIMALKISGSDLAPRTELLPDEIFTRSMTVQFHYPFSFIVEQEVAKAIEITLTSVNPSGVGTPVPGEQIIVSRITL